MAQDAHRLPGEVAIHRGTVSEVLSLFCGGWWGGGGRVNDSDMISKRALRKQGLSEDGSDPVRQPDIHRVPDTWHSSHLNTTDITFIMRSRRNSTRERIPSSGAKLRQVKSQPFLSHVA